MELTWVGVLARHPVLRCAAAEGTGAEAPPQPPEKEGALHKAGRIAAEVLGVRGLAEGAGHGAGESPAAKAARYLGADSINLTVDSVRGWWVVAAGSGGGGGGSCGVHPGSNECLGMPGVA